MRYLTLLLGFVLIQSISLAGDVFTLNNGQVYHGECTNLTAKEVTFSIENTSYIIPIADLAYLSLEQANKKQYRVFNRLIASGALGEGSTCETGNADGAMHGHTVGHVALGFFFGPFGVAGAALSAKKPSKSANFEMIAGNQGMWGDPGYLACYEKTAKNKALGNSSAGWLAWLILILI